MPASVTTIGLVRPQLAYKTARYGARFTVADRWFASSQIHHGCHRPDGTPCRLTGTHRIDKHLVCPLTGDIVDRDHNAARNLRDWPDTPVDAQSVLRPRPSAVAAVVSQTAAQTIGPTDGPGSSRKTIPTGRPRAMRPNRNPATGKGTPRGERLNDQYQSPRCNGWMEDPDRPRVAGSAHRSTPSTPCSLCPLPTTVSDDFDYTRKVFDVGKPTTPKRGLLTEGPDSRADVRNMMIALTLFVIAMIAS